MSNRNSSPSSSSTGVTYHQQHTPAKKSGSAARTEKTKEQGQSVVISPRQSASIVASTIIGVGVLTFPRVTVAYTSEAAWISTIVGSLAAVISISILTQLGLRFPYQNIAQYSEKILGSEQSTIGRYFGKVLSFPFIIGLWIFWILTTATVSRTFGEVVVASVLQNTPIEVIILSMLLTALGLVLNEVEVLARVNEILLPLIIIPVLFIALFSFQSFELENILPLWPGLSISQFMSGCLVTLIAYHGFEIISVLSTHTQITNKNIRLNIFGILVPAIIYFLIVVAGISVFGNQELEYLMWPTLELVKVTQAPGLVLERMESAFLGVWVTAVFTTTANLYYAATMILTQFLNLKAYRRWLGCAFLPLIYSLSLVPQNVFELFIWEKSIGYLGLTVGTIFPTLLFVISKIRKKGATHISYTDEQSSNDTQNTKRSSSKKQGDKDE